MELENINLNLLITFYHVAVCGNITKTAEKLYTSQPAISRAIKQLESHFNTQLFYRTLTGVNLTEKGVILFNAVEKMIENLNLADVKLRQADNFEKGRLIVGVPSHICGLYLFDAISVFHKLYPKVDITIISKSTTQLLSLLKNHEIDFVIDTDPISINSKNFKLKSIKEFENCFFVSNKFASLNKHIKSLKDLQDYPVILPIPKTANRKDIDNLLMQENVVLNNILNVHTSEMIIDAVKRDVGIGYALKDLIADEVTNGEVHILQLKEKLPTSGISLVYEKDNLSEIANYFITNHLKICL